MARQDYRTRLMPPTPIQMKIVTLCASKRSGRALALASLLLLPAALFAQLRSPTYGWNLGNTMEADGGVGSWAPAPTQALINAVAAAGFNTIRIPCAWDTNANHSNNQINATYMAQVKQVVDWCYAKNLTVIINCHWDGGWLDSTLANGYNSTVNTKMNTYWTQIANTFQTYDSRLLFAAANEPPVSDANGMATLKTYYQTFINAVRATGGNNTSRWLVLSGPSVSIDLSSQLFTTMPNDSTSGRLIVEVHHYPYQWALMNKDADWGKMFYFWGQGYHHATRTDRNSTWGEEADLDSQLQKAYDSFVSRGIPVLMGEFGAIRRIGLSDLTGTDLNLHLASRTYYDKTVVDKANAKGVRPVYWDEGYTGSNGFAVFDRNTNGFVDADSARALVGGAALPPPGGGGIITNGIYKIVARHSGKALDVVGWGTTDGTNVDQWTYGGGNNQRWAITHLGNNQYEIVNLNSGKALDVTAAATTNGTNVEQWIYGGGAHQKWTISATSGGYYRLTPTHATSMCLDVNAASTTDGANVQIWTYGGGNNQQWIFQTP